VSVYLKMSRESILHGLMASAIAVSIQLSVQLADFVPQQIVPRAFDRIPFTRCCEMSWTMNSCPSCR
jgi:hypothetical protein